MGVPLAKPKTPQTDPAAQAASWYQALLDKLSGVPGGGAVKALLPTDAPSDLLGNAMSPLGMVTGPLAGPGARLARLMGEQLKRIPNPIKAWHGSPFDFDQFEWSPRTRKTGEGTAAYGEGIYLAERDKVAKTYRPSEAVVDVGGTRRPVPFWGDTMNAEDRAVRRLSDKRAKFPEANDEEVLTRVRADLRQEQLNPYSLKLGIEDELDALSRFQEAGIKTGPAGRLYEVNIHTRPEQLLDLDAPMRDQTSYVRDAVTRALQAKDAMPPPVIDELLGSKYDLPGTELYRMLGGGTMHTPDNLVLASKRLREAGVPGLKFFDRDSRYRTPTDVGYAQEQLARAQDLLQRAAGKPALQDLYATDVASWESIIKEAANQPPQTRNFVITDTELLEIAGKFGIPLATAASLVKAQGGTVKSSGTETAKGF